MLTQETNAKADSRSQLRSGFTLIELLVVSVLTAILLTAVMGVLRSIWVRRQPNIQVLSLTASNQLRMDLQNATHYRVSANTLNLFGILAIDSKDHRPLGHEAEIRYWIRPTSQGGLLVREQWAGQPPFRQHDIDPVWLGISSIDFNTDFILQDQTLEAPFPFSEATGWRTLPPGYRVRLRNISGQVCFSDSVVGSQYD